MNKQRGSVSTEWTVATMALLVVLFTPLPGEEGRSLMAILMDSIRGFYMNTAWLLSLP